MREIFSEIEIAAPPDRVFETLTDLASYPEWNPFIVEAHGVPRPGSTLRIRIHPPGARHSWHRVTVLRLEKDREFRWLGHWGLPGLLDGDHAFTLVALDGGSTRLVHHEEFRGLLVPLFWRIFLDTKMREGFSLLNRSLKDRVERV